MEAEIVRAPRPRPRIGHGEAIPRWSRTSRLALGVWTATVPAFALLSALWGLFSPADQPTDYLGVATATIIAHFIVTLFYLSFAVQNPRLRMKGTWLAALVLAGPISIPIYWVLHVWHAPRIGVADVDDEVPGFDEKDARADHVRAAV